MDVSLQQPIRCDGQLKRLVKGSAEDDTLKALTFVLPLGCVTPGPYQQPLAVVYAYIIHSAVRGVSRIHISFERQLVFRLRQSCISAINYSFITAQ